MVQRTARTRFAEGFIERGRFRGGQQALAWWRVAGGGDGAGGGGAHGGGAGDNAASRRRERGRALARVFPRTFRWAPAARPAPRAPPPHPGRPAACEAHPPAFALPHGHTPASRAHAASPRRPAHARPLGADARPPPWPPAGHAGRARGGGLAAVWGARAGRRALRGRSLTRCMAFRIKASS